MTYYPFTAQSGRHFLHSLCATALLAVAASPAMGQTVTITHKDQTVEVVELQQAEADVFYWIVDGNQRVYLKPGDHCAGAACPGSAAESAQQSATPGSSEKLGIYGSNTIGAELMPQLIAAYADKLSANIDTMIGAKPEERTLTAIDSSGSVLFEADLKAHGSGTSFPALQRGEAEIGMASRHVKPKEEDKLAEAGITNIREAGKEHVVALDGLVVVVSPDNPIKVLSLKQIAQLFSGEISNWSQLGGLDQAVTIYARDNNSGTYDTFKGLVLKPNGKKLSESAKRYESNEKLSDEVSQDIGGIGFTGFAYLRNAKPLALASDCGIVSVPSIFDVKTEEYPLSRRLYLYTTGKPLSLPAQGLLDFSLSDDAQSVIADVGFIDQSIDLLNFNMQGQRLANTILPSNMTKSHVELPIVQKMFTLLQHSDRLSTTFRFNTGASDLDVKAQQDISRIANLMSTPDSGLAGKDIYLVGFTDSVGGFVNNARLSKNRAMKIYDVLSARIPKNLRHHLKVVGYGELSPVACNTTQEGRTKNRRVEVWVK